MLAGKYDLTIYKGGASDIPLTFVDSNGDPLDLTGLSPFVAKVRDSDTAPTLLTFTVVDTDLQAGQINLTTTAADTASLPIRDSLWGIADANDVVWVQGVCRIAMKIP